MNIVIILLIILVPMVWFFVWQLNGIYNANSYIDTLDCQHLKNYVNYALEYKYDMSVITNSNYAIKRIIVNCLN